jgi:hypothetical protein
VNQLTLSLAALALVAALEAQAPAATPASPRPQWQPRPVIMVDPRPYLSTPSPQPLHHATPRPTHRTAPHPRATPARRPAAMPETFERLDTSPSPVPPHRSRVQTSSTLTKNA